MGYAVHLGILIGMLFVATAILSSHFSSYGD